MENTKIEWTATYRADGTVVPGHTFNPWWGCVKVSPGCEHCYAETFSKRTGHNIWGPPKTTDRRLFGDKHWAEPLKWDRKAQQAGERRRVFCASMADVFEDHPQVVEPRRRLFETIDSTPNLDWLLLTKRPENIQRLWPFGWYDDQYSWPNVWIGTSVEDQKTADERIRELVKIPAAIRFLSIEPLLAPIDMGRAFPCGYYCDPDMDGGGHHDHPFWSRVDPQIQWIIIGGESGPGARNMDMAWVRSLMRQCRFAGVPVFVKQLGSVAAKTLGLKHAKGGDIDEWAVDLRVREFPSPQPTGFRDLAAAWPTMPDLPDGVDIFAEKYGPPTGSEA